MPARSRATWPAAALQKLGEHQGHMARTQTLDPHTRRRADAALRGADGQYKALVDKALVAKSLFVDWGSG
ncbi:MAG: hypothetical protein Q8P61_00515 [Candidatus Nanopelagicales bacterium]|nr:hypothetical protein [Candidatus Nanopelagicales bacterium]